MRSSRFSIEYKNTSAKSFRLTLMELQMAERNALLDDRIMLFGICLAGRNYIVLTEEDFTALTVTT